MKEIFISVFLFSLISVILTGAAGPPQCNNELYKYFTSPVGIDFNALGELAAPENPAYCNNINYAHGTTCCRSSMYEMADKKWHECLEKGVDLLEQYTDSMVEINLKYKQSKKIAETIKAHKNFKWFVWPLQVAVEAIISEAGWTPEKMEKWKVPAKACYRWQSTVMKGAICSYCSDEAFIRWGESSNLTVSPADFHEWCKACSDYLQAQFEFLNYTNSVEKMFQAFYNGPVIPFAEKALATIEDQKEVQKNVNLCKDLKFNCENATISMNVAGVFAFSILTQLDQQQFTRIVSIAHYLTTQNPLKANFDDSHMDKLASTKDKDGKLIPVIPKADDDDANRILEAPAECEANRILAGRSETPDRILSKELPYSGLCLEPIIKKSIVYDEHGSPKTTTTQQYGQYIPIETSVDISDKSTLSAMDNNDTTNMMKLPVNSFKIFGGPGFPDGLVDSDEADDDGNPMNDIGVCKIVKRYGVMSIEKEEAKRLAAEKAKEEEEKKNPKPKTDEEEKEADTGAETKEDEGEDANDTFICRNVDESCCHKGVAFVKFNRNWGIKKPKMKACYEARLYLNEWMIKYLLYGGLRLKWNKARHCTEGGVEKTRKCRIKYRQLCFYADLAKKEFDDYIDHYTTCRNRLDKGRSGMFCLACDKSQQDKIDIDKKKIKVDQITNSKLLVDCHLMANFEETRMVPLYAAYVEYWKEVANHNKPWKTHDGNWEFWREREQDKDEDDDELPNTALKEQIKQILAYTDTQQALLEIRGTAKSLFKNVSAHSRKENVEVMVKLIYRMPDKFTAERNQLFIIIDEEINKVVDPEDKEFLKKRKAQYLAEEDARVKEEKEEGQSRILYSDVEDKEEKQSRILGSGVEDKEENQFWPTDVIQTKWNKRLEEAFEQTSEDSILARFTEVMEEIYAEPIESKRDDGLEMVLMLLAKKKADPNFGATQYKMNVIVDETKADILDRTIKFSVEETIFLLRFQSFDIKKLGKSGIKSGYKLYPYKLQACTKLIQSQMKTLKQSYQQVVHSPEISKAKECVPFIKQLGGEIANFVQYSQLYTFTKGWADTRILFEAIGNFAAQKKWNNYVEDYCPQRRYNSCKTCSDDDEEEKTVRRCCPKKWEFEQSEDGVKFHDLYRNNAFDMPQIEYI